MATHTCECVGTDSAGPEHRAEIAEHYPHADIQVPRNRVCIEDWMAAWASLHGGTINKIACTTNGQKQNSSSQNSSSHLRMASRFLHMVTISVKYVNITADAAPRVTVTPYPAILLRPRCSLSTLQQQTQSQHTQSSGTQSQYTQPSQTI